MIGVAGVLDLLVDTISDILPVWTVFLGFGLLIGGAIATNIAYQINRKEKKKLSIEKNKGIICQVCQHEIKGEEEFVKSFEGRENGLSHKTCAKATNSK